jgi:hypothetical protein
VLEVYCIINNKSAIIMRNRSNKDRIYIDEKIVLIRYLPTFHPISMQYVLYRTILRQTNNICTHICYRYYAYLTQNFFTNTKCVRLSITAHRRIQPYRLFVILRKLLLLYLFSLSSFVILLL